MTAVQVYNVSFDTTDEGFDALTPSQVKMLEGDIEGRIFEIDADSNNIEEFNYKICEEISSETGWLVHSFEYRLITIGE